MLKIKEKILLLRIRKKDRQAFGEIYNEYADQIYRFLYLRVPPADCDDLLQETFLNLWNYLSDGHKKEVANLKALLYKIAKNIVASYHENSQPEQLDLEIAVTEEKHGLVSGVATEMDLQADMQKISQAMAALENELYREILEMHFLDQLSHQEIAAVIEKDVGTTRVLLHRAIKKVKEEIGKSEQ